KLKIDSNLLSFEEAIVEYSDDDSKNNGGLIINPQTGTTHFTYEELDPSIRFMVEKMSEGDISKPSLTKSQDGTQAAYRLLKIKGKKLEHKANVIDDFDLLKEYALANKKQTVLDNWVTDNLDATFISLSPELSKCSCYNKWNN
ncbi:MAG: hypothetical protein CMP72_03485, partial [Flavobacteriales bacterium]|nr:hypothetical protein [Flavobacteriales bacterium]